MAVPDPILSLSTSFIEILKDHCATDAIAALALVLASTMREFNQMAPIDEGVSELIDTLEILAEEAFRASRSAGAKKS